MQGPDFKYTHDDPAEPSRFRGDAAGGRNRRSARGAREFSVTARRIDGFDGPIRVDIEDLPPGFSATTPLVIEPGQTEAVGVITADAEQRPPRPSRRRRTRSGRRPP